VARLKEVWADEHVDMYGLARHPFEGGLSRKDDVNDTHRTRCSAQAAYLRHAEQIGDVCKTCRYSGIARGSFYRWKAALQRQGEAGLVNRKPVPRNPANRTPPEIVEKVLHLRRTYHLGPIRIVWYLARYHDIKISDAGVNRILRRNGLNRLSTRQAGSQEPRGNDGCCSDRRRR
jgi:transposase